MEPVAARPVGIIRARNRGVKKGRSVDGVDKQLKVEYTVIKYRLLTFATCGFCPNAKLQYEEFLIHQ